MLWGILSSKNSTSKDQWETAQIKAGLVGPYLYWYFNKGTHEGLPLCTFTSEVNPRTYFCTELHRNPWFSFRDNMSVKKCVTNSFQLSKNNSANFRIIFKFVTSEKNDFLDSLRKLSINLWNSSLSMKISS